MMIDWPCMKASFNHDWLRNDILMLLGAIRNVINGHVDNSSVVDRLKYEINEWPTHKKEADELIKQFEQVMSPLVFFSIPPLLNCSFEVLSWLPELAHRRWRNRHSIYKLVEDARYAIRQLDNAFLRMYEFNPITVDKLCSMEFREALTSLTNAATATSDAFCRLPNRIMI